MRRLTLTLIVVLTVSVVLFVALLPPATEHVAVPAEWQALAARTLAGAYHVHSTRSDGSGTKAEIAAAARRVGLQFVILTDHGDGTRPPDPPAYIDGVLMLDAVEISSDDGHYVALDMPRAPYPLGGSGAAVVEDVARLGGFGIAAHPDSAKPALRWRDRSLPVDGIEWLNADSAWRDESRLSLARTMAAYFARPGPALARMLDRPATLDEWDAMATSRPVVALAAADAHGGVGRRAEESGRSLSRLPIPSYEASFRTFTNRVVLDRPPAGDAAADARALFDAIRTGRSFTLIDAAATPGLLDFRRDASAVVARVLGPADAETVLLYQGRSVARARSEVRWETGDAGGAYRVEVRRPGMPGKPPVPWLVSNAIFMGDVALKPAVPGARSRPFSGARSPAFPWRIEKDPSSSAIVRRSADGVELEYQLGGDSTRSPYVALASDLRAQAFSAIELSVAASRPMRISVQVRRDDEGRWGSSVYVPIEPVTVRIPLAGMRPFGAAGAVPEPTALTSVLLVIDLTNAAPTSSGQLRVLSAELVNY